LTIGPLHKHKNLNDGADLICRAYEAGINFFDTAELYGTYEYLKLALKKHPDLIIASKSYAVTADEMRISIELARKELDRDYVDIFCIHQLENVGSIAGHRGALDYLNQAKADGLIKAVGISTHRIAGVRAGATEPGIDIIHPLVNQSGIGIQDGTVTEMLAALDTAKEFGKGIYAMKVLAGGHLGKNAYNALRFVAGLNTIDSIAVGMQSVAEVQLNLAILSGEPLPENFAGEVMAQERKLTIASWCELCGKCVQHCGFDALSIHNNLIHIDQDRCVRCGYCARVCPEFCLKVV
jgi:aryl-alcohol dehydrogenase-like predicted oxidoreductase